MTTLTRITRRTLLRASLASAVIAVGTRPLAPLLLPDARATGQPFVPDVSIELHARPDWLNLLSGPATSVWRYDGNVVHGDPRALSFLSDGYAPVVRVRRGQKVRIEFVNDLPEPTIVHWHGLRVPASMDGHPRDAIATNQRHVYEFEILNRAGTYWFHAHPDGRTGAQIYQGQAGFMLVDDDEQAALALPQGEYDVPLMIQDRTIDNTNQFVYLTQRTGGMMGRGMMSGQAGEGAAAGGMGDMMAQMMGFLGDRILVNGRPNYVLPVATRAYRLRLLNASNSRIYKLAWSDGASLTVIGTDGGLLDRPLRRRYVTLAPAERFDLWVDFSGKPTGTVLTLESQAFAGDVAMGGMMTRTALPMGARFPVLSVKVARRERGNEVLPSTLSRIPAARWCDAINFMQPRSFGITMGMMTWGIDGRRFEMNGVSPAETVKAGTAEVWEFRNDASMMLMARAMHVHGVQFRVLARTVDADFAEARRTLSDGYVDDGWKDTVFLMPGERVRLLVHFGERAGLYLYHCHMLEHEDTGLMRNYLVEH
ncbi:multicopper oxidase family protein [Burkholderia pseudomultivorans]|uniref:multicopper oxidase family protein n=1 Tax=Burkholderia pseudomultivorans TaxID=1207504 RepID=UPI0018906638|nr:multicopper oxidase domain-containing protein [Burkholderia pseudomultivorans]MBF5008669.1 multicopper oxidase domain-containing protein [Burkholderia pseudomultivorans]